MRDEQIERFYRRQCTAEEAIEVARYLRRNPEILEKFEGKDDWDRAAAGISMPPEFWEEVWRTIDQKRKSNGKVVFLKRSLIAASLLAAVLIGYYQFHSSPSAAFALRPAQDRPLVLHKREVNHTRTIYRLELQDGSVVRMAPGAAIRFDLPFSDHERNIQLEGEADFQVAKDERRPFTVYSGKFSTTALGTEFTVIEQQDRGIIVKLISGKVIVKTTDPMLKGWRNDVYLSPGQQMRYDAGNGLVAVQQMHKASSSMAVRLMTRPVAHRIPDPEELSFNGTSLVTVIDSLASFYHATILYDTTIIKDMNFSGHINRSDSLHIVLKLIAQMNDLEVTGEGRRFFVRKLVEK